MSAALDLVPLLAGFGTACGAIGTAVGKWLAGRSKERTVSAAGASRVAVSEQETARAELAHDTAISPALLKRIEALEAQRDDCHEALTGMRAIVGQAGHDLEQVRDEVREANARAERAEERCAVLEDQLLRWHGALPAGSD